MKGRSRFGRDDQLGTMNFLTPELILSAARLVKKGRVVSLSHLLEDGIPSVAFHQGFVYSTFHDMPWSLADIDRRFQNSNRAAYMNMRLEMSDHAGTHIDALNHAGIGLRLYNGNDARRIATAKGTTRLGIETMPPLFGRGILVDMTLLKKPERRYRISLRDFNKVLKMQGLSVSRGDSVLIFTGWQRFWKKDNARYLSTMPGIGKELARWLAEAGVLAVGSDTAAVEVEPGEDSTEVEPVHQILLTKNGIHMLESLDLVTLAEERVYEFLFVCLPLRIKGGTGSPVNPVAVF